MSFPLAYLEHNLIVNNQREVWAAYRLHPWHYEYLSGEARLAHLQRLTRLLWHLEDLEGQILLLPRPHVLTDHLQDLAGSGPLSDWYRQSTTAALPALTAGTRPAMLDHDYLLLLKLADAPNLGTDLAAMGKGFFRRPRQMLRTLAGTGPLSLLAEQISAWLDREEQLHLRVSRIVRCSRLSPAETAAVVARRFGNQSELPADWHQPITVDEEPPALVRPDTGALTALADGCLHLSHPGYVRRVNAREETTYQAFAVVADTADDIPFPGGEWLYSLHDLPFPVEVCLRWRALNYRQGLSEVRKRKLELTDQDEHTRHSGQDLPLALLEAQEDILLLEHDLKQRKSPLLDVTVHLSVTATSLDQLRSRVRHLKEFMQTHQMTVEVPGGDQLLAFTDFLPGTPHALRDYVLRLPPEALAASMFLASRALGDESGPYLGRTGLLSRPVYLDPSLPPRINRSASIAFLGSLGGGKSFTANLVTYLAVVARGARTLILDPKGERGDWPRLLPELAGHLRVITLGGSEQDRGKLDPFVIGRTLREGDQREITSLAASLLCFLTGAQTGDARFLAIMEAVERVHAVPNPSLTAVMEELERMGQHDPEVHTLARYLRAMSTQGHAHLLFGSGHQEGLDLSSLVSVLQIQHLQLPPAGKPRVEYTLEELVSVGLMHAVTAYASRFAQQDRHVFKVVLLDEAWALLQSSQGKALISQLLRTGRSLNTAIYLVTQNCADLLDETIKNNLGIKFIFRSQDRDEIQRVLQFLNLEGSPEAADAVRNLETGQALLQDLAGRVGLVQIDALLPHLAAAFNTVPTGAEEVRP